MRRSRLLLVLSVALTSLASVVPARAATGVDRFMENSHFCDTAGQFRNGPAVVDGPSAQLDVHTEVFDPAFGRACRIGSGLVTYLGTGERAGINAVLNRRAERAFGTTDVPLTPVEVVEGYFDLRAPDRRGRTTAIHQIPLAVAITSVVYNLSTCSTPRLNLRSPVLSAIYSGTITRWNDPLLVQDNPSLASCTFPIRLVKRADFAGTTATFKDYLSKRNPQWNYYKQPAQNQSWPTITNACPALDEGGVADCIRSTQYSIGYIQARAAKVAGLKTAYLDNVVTQFLPDPADRFVAPTPQGCTAAAASAFVPPGVQKTPIQVTQFYTYETQSVSPTRGDWSTVSLTDARDGYPMCSFSYALIYISLQTAYVGQQYLPNTGRTAVDYLWTAVNPDAQSKLPAFSYGALPQNVADVSKLGISEIRFQG